MAFINLAVQCSQNFIDYNIWKQLSYKTIVTLNVLWDLVQNISLFYQFQIIMVLKLFLYFISGLKHYYYSTKLNFFDLYFYLNMLLLSFVLNALLIEFMSQIDCVWFIWAVELSTITMKFSI